MNDFSKRMLFLKETQSEGLINLSRNETFIKRKIKAKCNLSAYPSLLELRLLLAEKHSVDPMQIVIGAGSSEILAVAARVGSTIAKRMQVDSNSYGPIQNLIRSTGCFPTNKSTQKVRFIVNPNNPTGEFKPRTILRDYQCANRLLVVDEAYVDFYMRKESTNDIMPFYGYSFADEINHSDNLIVTRTFSKLKGLPGIRVGYGICSENIAKKVRKFESVYSISDHSIYCAIEALNDESYEVEYAKENIASMGILYNGLRKLGVETYLPCGNFIAAKIPEVHGFLTRDLTHYSSMPGWRRITTHNIGIMNHFLNQLEKTLEKQK